MRWGVAAILVLAVLVAGAVHRGPLRAPSRGAPPTVVVAAGPQRFVPPPTPGLHAPWRRTADGWQRAGWLAPSSIRSPAIHPLVVALLQALLSAVALVAFDAPSRHSTRRASP